MDRRDGRRADGEIGHTHGLAWQTTTPMSQRLEFAILATQSPVAFKELCRRYGVSRKTGYKWLERYKAGGAEALRDRSRRPHHSPKQVPQTLAELVLALRVETG